MTYIQELSGEVWTDYNAHDPGVTILEQLCYALTDIAYRTSLPITSFLAPFTGEKLKEEAGKNAFFDPSIILTSPVVTDEDMRKVILDKSDAFGNAWIYIDEYHDKEKINHRSKGRIHERNEEKLRGLCDIQLLAKQDFRKGYFTTERALEKEYLGQAEKILRENRRLGEDFSDPTILKNQNIDIDFEVHLSSEQPVGEILAHLFIDFFEFMYTPVHHYSLEEMKDAGYSIGEIFSGPRMTRGFIKRDELKDRLTSIQVEDIQKRFLKIKGVQKCKVNGIKENGRLFSREFKAAKGKYLNVLYEGEFKSIYKNMKVFVSKNTDEGTSKSIEINVTEFHDDILNNVNEIWSKEHREYVLSGEGYFLNEKLEGKHDKSVGYYSLQHHFPLIYGIGKEGVPDGNDLASLERKSKALQLKAYLLFFEKHLANHLSQLGNMNEFFNIFFEYKENAQTYFSQPLDNVPEFDKLQKGDAARGLLEQRAIYFQRKNKIYDHLLGRFGEDLNELPWRISLEHGFLKNNNELNVELLKKKSEFLTTLGNLNADKPAKQRFHGIKGEDFGKEFRIPSGLEQLLMAKTGIPFRDKREKIRKDDEYLHGEGFYIVDHILLRDFLQDEDITYGFSFRDEYNIPLFGTKHDKSWGATEEEREEKLTQFFYASLRERNYIPHDEASFKEKQERNIVDFKIDKERRKIRADLLHLKDMLTEVSENDRDELLLKEIPDILRAHSELNVDIGFTEELNKTAEPLLNYVHELEAEKKSIQMIKRYIDAIAAQLENLYAGKDDKLDEKSEHTVLATYDFKDQVERSNQLVKQKERRKVEQESTFNGFYKNTRSCTHLFHDPEDSYTGLRLAELEKKRARGSLHKIDQRRLVFQRKVRIRAVTDLSPDQLEGFKIIDKDFIVIDEDFFDLKISVVLPASPKRFMGPKFKGYVTDLIYERSPVHIANNLFWLSDKDMEEFEEAYNYWEKLKSKPKKPKERSPELEKAAFAVYRKIIQFKRKYRND